MKNTYRLNTFLAVVAGLVFLGYLAEHALLPPPSCRRWT